MTMSTASDLERTYAGVLGKMAGVYLGRPVEGWSAERIRAEHGDLSSFLPGSMIPVSDDDISGAFTFVRALEDGGFSAELIPSQVGEVWLDQLIEGRTTLWWGGVGSSTEHTAYVRLASGVPAPRSGSAALNGRRAAEQIGARIFADAWGLAHPHEPRRAAAAARAAAQVSHDGVAVDAAGLLAASVAAAFDGAGVTAALERGRAEVPAGSQLHDLIDEVAAVYAGNDDWRVAHGVLAGRHPYARYGGHCPLVPNETVVLLALMAATDDLARALSIAVGCGWDTDCNAGNVGCLIGAALGLDAFATPSAGALRSAMNDRLFVVAAEGGESVTDALTVARRLDAYARFGRAGAPGPARGTRPAGDRAAAGSEEGAPAVADHRARDGRPRYDFELPGATQGFRLEGPGATELALGAPGGGAGLVAALDLAPVPAPERDPAGAGAPPHVWRLTTPTFSRAAERALPGYALVASPTLYPGQTIRATVAGAPAVWGRIVVACEAHGGVTQVLRGPEFALADAPASVIWRVPATPGPIVEVGAEFRVAEPTPAPTPARRARLVSLGWDGAPCLALDGDGLRAWRHAWVDAFDHVHADPGGGIAFAHDRPGGWAGLGGRAWDDVRLDADVELPQEGEAGVFIRGRGVRRRLALWLTAGAWRLELGGAAPCMLAGGAGGWSHGDTLTLSVEACGRRARAWVDGRPVADLELPGDAPASGAAGVLAGPGTLALRSLRIAPAGTA
jgi:ADP-ribosylglycohydrolase